MDVIIETLNIEHCRNEDSQEYRSEDDTEIFIKKNKKRIQHFSDSDDEIFNQPKTQEAQTSDECNINKNTSVTSDEEVKDDSQSCIKKVLSNETENKYNEISVTEHSPINNEEQLSRIKSKRKKLRNKFHNLLSSRKKDSLEVLKMVENKNESNTSIGSSDSDGTYDEVKRVTQVNYYIISFFVLLIIQLLSNIFFIVA